jgi:hypothetical protein
MSDPKTPIEPFPLDDPDTLVEPAEPTTMPPPPSLESIDRKLDQLMQAVANLGGNFLQHAEHTRQAIDELGGRVKRLEPEHLGNGHAGAG